MQVIKDMDTASNKISGTYKVGSLVGVSYWDLKNTFGTPTFNEASADDKVQKEWVFDFKGQTFTIYDWKTYDEQYTVEELKLWSIGGNSNADDFETMVLHLIANQPVSEGLA